MDLTLNQSIQVYVSRFKEVYYSNKFKFTSKFPYTCFNCGKLIFVPFNMVRRGDVLCDDCKHLVKVQRDDRNPQFSYINEIKEKQLPIIMSSVPEGINLEGLPVLKARKTPKAKPIMLLNHILKN